MQPRLINDSIEIHSDEQVGIYTNMLVDEDNSEATSTEVEKWKEGEIKLYNANFSINVYKTEKINTL